VEVDVRVVAATNRDLEKMMISGEFREDLYYRLRVIELIVPSLRERRDEIPTLTESFVSRYARKYKRPAPRISPELRALFLEYEWPGNIRELENMIKRLVILQDEQLVFSEIQRSMRRAAAAPAPVALATAAIGVPVGTGVPAEVGVAAAAPALPVSTPTETQVGEGPDDALGDAPADEAGGSLAAVAKAAAMKAERAIIEKTLGQVHWNRRKAAQILGVSYKTLLNKIKECEITRD
jgi:DNA-binding NtrC family response regulator